MAISSAYRHHGDLHNACPEIVFLDRVYSQTHVDHDRPNKKNKKQKKKQAELFLDSWHMYKLVKKLSQIVRL